MHNPSQLLHHKHHHSRRSSHHRISRFLRRPNGGHIAQGSILVSRLEPLNHLPLGLCGLIQVTPSGTTIYDMIPTEERYLSKSRRRIDLPVYILSALLMSYLTTDSLTLFTFHEIESHNTFLFSGLNGVFITAATTVNKLWRTLIAT